MTLKMINISDKSYLEIQNALLTYSNIFEKIRKYMVQSDIAQ